MSPQALPNVPHDGFIDVPGSNRAQQRGAHGLFRFFGKLAPDVTARVLDLALYEAGASDAPVVDLMCGSGTTLLEANDRGLDAIGIDCNPVAVLYAQAKTTKINVLACRSALTQVRSSFEQATDDQVIAVFGRLRNYDRWFTEEAMTTLAGLRIAIEALKDSPEKRLLLAVLVSRARKASNASERTGRIFFDPESAAADPLADFASAAERAIDAARHFASRSRVILADARAVPLESGTAHIVFCHPPYFGLYRYSSDVLRFELALGGFDARSITPFEVREGWKSGDPSNLDHHARDMADVFAEAARLVRPDGVFVIVTSNSTLGDHQLPVIDRLVEKALNERFKIVGHYVRRARNGSATYHRSARTDKVINQDHVLLFRLN
jgi:site-specific DNA-methyltransferase (cytosine-N4-specific)